MMFMSNYHIRLMYIFMKRLYNGINFTPVTQIPRSAAKLPAKWVYLSTSSPLQSNDLTKLVRIISGPDAKLRSS